MQKLFVYILNSIHLFAALLLIMMSLLIMGWAVYEVIASIPLKGEFIPRMLRLLVLSLFPLRLLMWRSI